jgi:hypothetical protein
MSGISLNEKSECDGLVWLPASAGSIDAGGSLPPNRAVKKWPRNRELVFARDRLVGRMHSTWLQVAGVAR